MASNLTSAGSSSSVAGGEDREPLSALIFAVDDQRYAVPLGDVLEVTRAVAVTKPSDTESALVGYVDLRGDVIQVVGARELLGLPSRPIGLTDRFIVIRAGLRPAAIIVDTVYGVEEVDLIAAAGHDQPDGVSVGRRAGGADGEPLVAFIDVDRLLARSGARHMEATPA